MKHTPTQSQIDISNLRFYAAMASDFKWQTDIIHYGVISQTLSEIASRYAASDDLLKAIIESATDGRDCPEWLQERIADAQIAIKKATA